MADRAIEIERAQNLWASFQRKNDPMARGATMTADPATPFDSIGGLQGAKGELLDYSVAATNPEIYAKWGTHPPSGILLIGQAGSGKTLLGRALATNAGTSFVEVDIPRMAVDIAHTGGKVGELLQAWSQVLDEIPPVTIYFDELEFSQAQEIGQRRIDLPIGPIMDFLLELVDRATAAGDHLVLAATAHPDTLRPIFLAPGRFERVVEVTPAYPGDIVAALRIHATAAEARAGRPLMGDIDWQQVVSLNREAPTGDWIRLLNAVLRSKARADAAGEAVSPVDTTDLCEEVQRFNHTRLRIHSDDRGNYL